MTDCSIKKMAALLGSLLLFSGSQLGAEIPPQIVQDFRAGVGAQEGQGIAVDAQGNIYATGAFQGNATFGTTTLTNGGATDYYLAKYDSTGNVLWAVGAGNTGSDFGSDVILDAAGNVLVVGVIQGTNNFDSATTLQGLGKKDIFLAKYSPGGALIWARVAGTDSDDQAFDVAADGAGNYYIGGRINGVASFGSIKVGANSQLRSVLAKYSTDGTPLWAKDLGSAGSTETCGIAADAEGNVYFTGLSTDSPSGPFAAKFDTNGNQLWRTVSAGNSYFDEGSGVDHDAAGNAYVAGRFTGTSLTLGDFTIDNPGGFAHGFIAKYDSTGKPMWGISGGARAFDVQADADGTIYVTGFYNATAGVVGTQSLPQHGGLDIYVAKISTAGEVQWVFDAGNGNNDLGRAIFKTASGGIYFIGEGGQDIFGTGRFQGGVYIAQLGAATSPAPQLNIEFSGANLIVSWPPSFEGYTLETTAAIGAAFQRGVVNFSPVAGRENTYETPKPAGNLFIRLANP